MNASVAIASEGDREREDRLRTLIDQWTGHMRWRRDYDRWRENRLWQEDGQASRLLALRAVTGDLAGKQVLDIGSGMGGFLVAAQRNAIRAVGIEPNADYCAITRLRAARYGLPPRVTRGYGESLPFADHSFDVVLAQDILEHVRDPFATLREIHRVLKSSGVALVTVINRFAWRDPHYHLFGLNWLPRPVAEAVVDRVGRSKRGARFADNQALGDMYYDTMAGFTRRARAIGFTVTDTKERALMEDLGQGSGRYRTTIRSLRAVHALQPVYRLHRFAITSTYELALRPHGAAQ